MTMNRLVLEWEKKIKLHLEREMKFNQWRSKSFKDKHPTLIETKEEMDDEGEVRTAPNIADIRVEIINDKNDRSKDISNKKGDIGGLHVTPISTNVMEETTLGRTMNIRKVVHRSELPKKNSSSNTSTKLARAKLDNYSGDAGMSKDMLGPEQPGELRRSWYVKGHVMSEVISSVLAHRYQRTIRQRYSPCRGPLSLE
ncbi:hypothetical protein Tco_0576070 [Tanacetum coccineum]